MAGLIGAGVMLLLGVFRLWLAFQPDPSERPIYLCPPETTLFAPPTPPPLPGQAPVRPSPTAPSPRASYEPCD